MTPGAWSPDPWVLLPLALAGLGYGVGLARGARHGAARWRDAAAFGGGLAAIAAALLSPVGLLSERLLSVHVAQHELLVLVAAPLLVLGRPLLPFLYALPARWRPRALALGLRPPVLRAWALVTVPLLAAVLHAAVRSLWHLPALFDAALEHRPVHAVQHLSLLATALPFWWSIVHGRAGRAVRRASSAAAVLVALAHTGLLAASVALAPDPLYRSYAARLGARALADQRVAGIMLGVPAGALLAMAALALLAAALREPSRRDGLLRAPSPAGAR